MNNIKIFTLGFTLLIFFMGNNLFAQKLVKDEIRKGNSEYNSENYSKAEVNYRKALEAKSNNTKAKYNLANSLYKQKKYKEAAEAYEAVSSTDLTKEEKAALYHNLGNSYAQQKEWEKSVKNYKESLKLNPNDGDTRYNLQYAMQQLKQEQQKQENQKDKNKDQQDKDKDKDQNKDKDQENKENKDQEKKDEQNKEKKDENKDQEKKDQNESSKKDEDKKDQAQPKDGKPAKMNKQEAEQLLKAIAEKDKKTADKVEKKKIIVQKVKVEKDW